MSTYMQGELMASNMEAVASAFKLISTDQQALGAFLCTAQKRRADTERIKACKQTLRALHGPFSDFRQNMELPLIVKMSLTNNPQAYLEDVAAVYKMLSKKRIMGNESRLLAAVVILDQAEPAEWERVCDRTIDLYEKARKTHPILTSQDDLPMLALMALKDADLDQILDDAEACYQNIAGRKPALTKDAIQTIGIILALKDGSSEAKSASFLNMHQTFKDGSYKLDSMRASILAVLANSGISPEAALRQSMEIEETLKELKGFRGILGIDKRTRRFYAAAFTALNNTEGDPTAEVTVMNTILSIILFTEMLILSTTISAST